MKGYGQFCPLALATEIVGERWTPLVLRELLLGSRRFNDIHRGLPRMSPALLAKRLRTLEEAGIVARGVTPTGGARYEPTEAGLALAPAIESLSLWGKTWLPATLSDENADPDLVMWDLHRSIDPAVLPSERTVIRFDFTDQPKVRRCRWLVGDASAVELCVTEPGFEIDLLVTTDSRTITWVWYGDIPLKEALGDGRIQLDGPRRLCDAFPSWMPLSMLASVPRKHPLEVVD